MAQKLLSSKAKYCRSRQKAPGKFEKGTLRTTPVKPGVKKVTGCPKGSTYTQKKGVGCRTVSGQRLSTQVQTILYKAGTKACPYPGGKELSKGFPMRKKRKKLKKNPPSRTYTYFQDPGHGWIAVKVAELQQLQIEKKISTSSYLKGRTAYLEEDSDAATWYQAYVAQWGEEPKFKEKHTNKNSPIRSYPRYYRVLT